MKKKIISIALVIALVFSFSTVLAAEVKADVPENVLSDETNALTIDASVEDIKNAPLVDGEIPDLPDEVQTLVAPEIGTGDKVYKETGSGNQIIADEAVALKDVTVDGNLVVFAKDVDLNNVTVYGDIAIFAQYANITDLVNINGATVVAAERININSFSTAGNLYAAAEDIMVTAEAKGLYVATGKLNIGPDSRIGNVYDLKDVLPEEEVQEEVVVVSTRDLLIEKIVSILAVVVKTLFVCGFILLFTPEFVEKTKSDNIVKYIGFSALKGAGWTILIPIIAIALCCTGIAIGVAFATLAMYIIIFWASVPFVSIAIMNVVAKEDDTKWKKFGLTLCIAFAIAVLGKIPFIGGLVTILVAFSGMGIVIGSLKGSSCKCKKECKCQKEVEVAEEVKEEKSEEDK